MNIEKEAPKLVTSGIFSRKHGYIYLDRSRPNWMCCATLSPTELFERPLSIMDTIRMATFTLDSIWPYWEELMPISQYDLCCIKFSGIQTVGQKFGKGITEIDKGLGTDPTTNTRFYLKEEKSGKRVKVVEEPVLWVVNKPILATLQEKLDEVVHWVDTCPVTWTKELTPSDITAHALNFISLKDTPFKAPVSIPILNGFDITNMSGYAKTTKLNSVTLHAGQYGHLIRYYLTSHDDFASVLGAIPVGWKYSPSKICKPGEKI